MSLVSFDQVNYVVNDRCLMKNVDFHMEEGEHVGVIGPSGAGKTTFLNLLTGLAHPTSGRVCVLGQDLSKLDQKGLEKIRMHMGMLFQTNALFADWDVYENVAFAIRYHYGIPEPILNNIVTLKLDSVGLRGAQRLSPNELSGGMARRVSLARAIALDPKFIVYDEPFTGQDPVTRASLKQLMKRIHAKSKVASVTVSHDVHDLSEVVDRMLVIRAGEIIAEGTSKEIMNSKDPFVRDFIAGESERGQDLSSHDLLYDLLEKKHV